MLKSTIQEGIIWCLMPAHMSSYHTLGIKILTIIIHNKFSSFRPRGSNLKWKVNSLRLKVNSFRFKALKLKFKDSRDNKLLT